MELSVLNNKGKETGRKVKLNPRVFGIDPNINVVNQAVNAELTNLRQGTRSSKNRSNVRGGGKKPFKQK